MEEGFDVQKKFFQELKIKLPSNLSMANVVADELCISIDSAYRRIRGESDLSFKEFDLLFSKYTLSGDSVLSRSQDSINFSYRSTHDDQGDFSLYFNSIIKEPGLKEIIFTAMDLPIIYYFMYPKLASFKKFVWKRNVGEFHETDEAPTQYSLLDEEAMEKISNTLHRYLSIPTIEIWSKETLNNTLWQISYYNEIGMFQNKKDVLDILDELKKVINHIQHQAESGYKFMPGNSHSEQDNRDNFNMYYNAIPLTENITLLKFEKSNMVQLGNDPPNILTTTNEDFFSENYELILKIMKNASALNADSQKERKDFFNLLHHKIDVCIENI